MAPRPIAIISGGCGGIGSGIGRTLAENGFDIIALYLSTPKARAEAVVGGFAPGQHEAVMCDIRDGNTTDAVLADILRRRGVPAACIHAAVSPIIRKSLLNLSSAELDDQFAVGFFGGFNFMRPLAKAMSAAKHGVIIGLLSRAALQPETSFGRMGGYLLAKESTEALLKDMRKELSGSSVRVNAIAASFIDTPLSDDLPREVKAFLLERMPGEKEHVEDVADAALALCSGAWKDADGAIITPSLKKIADLA